MEPGVATSPEAKPCRPCSAVSGLGRPCGIPSDDVKNSQIQSQSHDKVPWPLQTCPQLPVQDRHTSERPSRSLRPPDGVRRAGSPAGLLPRTKPGRSSRGEDLTARQRLAHARGLVGHRAAVMMLLEQSLPARTQECGVSLFTRMRSIESASTPLEPGKPAMPPPVRRRRARVRDLKQPSGAGAKTSTRAPRKLSCRDGNAVATAVASRSPRRSPGMCGRSRYSCVCRGKVGRWDSAGLRRRGWGFPLFATPSGFFIVLALSVPGSGHRGRRGQ
jgi:hypothetical protein